MSSDDPGPVPLTRPDILFRRVGDEWVLFDPERDRLHRVNLTGALVWRLLADGEPLSTVEREVAAAFEVADAREAVSTAMDQFRDAGLLLRDGEG